MQLTVLANPLTCEYLTSRFGNPISLPKTASVNIGVKIAVCANVFTYASGHSTDRKESLTLVMGNILFNKPVDEKKILSGQKEMIAQQLHQYALEQITLEIAIYACMNDGIVDRAINAIVKKHNLKTDIDVIRSIFKRQRKTIISKLS